MTSDPSTCLSHVSLGTNDLPRARAFYDAALGALGLRRTMEMPRGVAYGLQFPELWITLPLDGQPASPGNGSHVCLRAQSIAQVRAFHAQAVAHGGQDAGAPGFRPHYTPQYYAAFVRDPDGHKLEAMCWADPGQG